MLCGRQKNARSEDCAIYCERFETNFSRRAQYSRPKAIVLKVIELLECIRKIHETRYLINAYDEEVLAVAQVSHVPPHPQLFHVPSTSSTTDQKLVEAIDKLSTLIIQQNHLLRQQNPTSYKPRSFGRGGMRPYFRLQNQYRPQNQ